MCIRDRSGSGKSTIALKLEEKLIKNKNLAFVLDGDNIRHGLSRDLGFSASDRKENIRRISETALLMNQAGIIVISSFISPYSKDRQEAKNIIGKNNFIEVFVNTPLNICESRDPKGLYKKARDGKIKDFTGVSAPYELPKEPEITIDTKDTNPEQAAEKIIKYLSKACNN